MDSRAASTPPTIHLAGILTTREKLWQAIRQLKEFDTRELARVCGVDRHIYRYADYLIPLVKAGILRKAQQDRVGECARYTLANDIGVDAPRLNRAGEWLPDSGRTRMWRAMKGLKTFSIRDLTAHASLPTAPIADKSASLYCTWLERGGYLALLCGGEYDVPRYRLIRNTGPKAPQILRIKQLFDANTGEIVAGEALETALDSQELEL